MPGSHQERLKTSGGSTDPDDGGRVYPDGSRLLPPLSTTPEPAMPRILFVDDEPMILNSLRLRFSRRHPDWECSFASDGLEALDHVSQGAFDVVVTDMRMPGMDGATLLGMIRERHPQTFRVVLSGQMSRDAQLRALPVTHRFHHKPCVPADLEQTIEQALDLSRQLDDQAIARVVGGLQRLPAAPRLYAEITRMMADHSVGLNQIARTVDQDPAMAARLLHVANSAFFGVRRQIRSSLEALNWLGVDLTRKLVLSSELAVTFGGGASRKLIEEVQSHATLTARIAARLVSSNRVRVVSTAALLHEVGRLVLANADPAVKSQINAARASGLDICAAEQSVLGFTHAEVGAYLLNLWGLPLDIVEAVAHHHSPKQPTRGCEFTTAGVIYIASELAIAARQRSPYAPDPRKLRLDPAWLRSAGVELKLHEWCLLANHQFGMMAQQAPASPA
jgi:putative nucleotidyltransferase with HDIG domain